MFNWFQKKSENACVYMCVKELKWDLKNSTPLRRAKILAIAQLLRHNFSEIPLFQDAINSPFNCPREQMITIYGGMENMRNLATIQLSQLKKTFSKLFKEFPDAIRILPFDKFPDEMEDHVKLTNKALEVWMTLIGCSFVPNVRDDVRKIWDFLLNSKGILKHAMTDLREFSVKQAQLEKPINPEIAQLIGRENVMYIMPPTDDEWLLLCDFIPSQFSKN